MKAHNNYFDVLLNTVSANHSYEDYLALLNLNGKMIVVGIPSQTPAVAPFYLLSNRRSIIGSSIGGMPETQEMLEYCAENNIVSDVELIYIDYINEAYERTIKGDVRFRFVIDIASLKKAGS